MNRHQESERLANVADDEFPIRILDRRPALDERLELGVVVVGVDHGLGKDRRIRGETTNTFVEPGLQLSVTHPAAAQVVEPGALALLVEQIVKSSHG